MEFGNKGRLVGFHILEGRDVEMSSHLTCRDFKVLLRCEYGNRQKVDNQMTS
jgi:hypothetical protein